MKINEFLKISLARYSEIVIGVPRKCETYHFESDSEIPDYLMDKKMKNFDIGFRCYPNSVFVRGKLEQFEFSSPNADIKLYIEI